MATTPSGSDSVSGTSIPRRRSASVLERDGSIELRFPYDPGLILVLRRLGGRWSASDRCWMLPNDESVWRRLSELFLLERPELLVSQPFGPALESLQNEIKLRRF